MKYVCSLVAFNQCIAVKLDLWKMARKYVCTLVSRSTELVNILRVVSRKGNMFALSFHFTVTLSH